MTRKIFSKKVFLISRKFLNSEAIFLNQDQVLIERKRKLFSARSIFLFLEKFPNIFLI